MSTRWPHDQVAPPGPDDEDPPAPGGPAGPSVPRQGDRAAADDQRSGEPPRGRPGGKPSRRERRGQAETRDRDTAGGGEDEDYEWIQFLTGGRGGAPDPAGPPPRSGRAAGPPPAAPRGGAGADGPRPSGTPAGESRPSRPAHGLLGRRSPGASADADQPYRNPPGPRDVAPIARFTPDTSGFTPDTSTPGDPHAGRDQAADDPYRSIAPGAGRDHPADDPYRFVAPAARRGQPAAEAPGPGTAPPAEEQSARPARGLLGRRPHRTEPEPDQPAARDVPPPPAAFAADDPPRGRRQRRDADEPASYHPPSSRPAAPAESEFWSRPDPGAEPGPDTRTGRRAARDADPSSGRRGRGRRGQDAAPEPASPGPRGSRPDTGQQADLRPPRPDGPGTGPQAAAPAAQADGGASGGRRARSRQDEASPDSGRRPAPRPRRGDAPPEYSQQAGPRRGDVPSQYGRRADRRRGNAPPEHRQQTDPRPGDARPESGPPADPRRADPGAGREPDPWSSRADGRGLGRRADRPAAPGSRPEDGKSADAESTSWSSPGFPRMDRQGFPTPMGEVRPEDTSARSPGPAERGTPPPAPQDRGRRRLGAQRPAAGAAPDAGTRSRRRAAATGAPDADARSRRDPDAVPAPDTRSRRRPAADPDRSIPVTGAAPGGWVARPGPAANDERASEQTSLDLPPFPDTSLPGLLAAATARDAAGSAKRGRKDPRPARADKDPKSARAEKPVKAGKPSRAEKASASAAAKAEAAPAAAKGNGPAGAPDTNEVAAFGASVSAPAEAGRGRSRTGRKSARRRSRAIYAAVGGVLVIAAAAGAFEALQGGGPSGPAHYIVTPQRIGGYAQAPALAASMKAAQVRRTIVAQSNGEAHKVVAAVYEGGPTPPAVSPSPGASASSSTAAGTGAATGQQIVLFIGGNLSGTSAKSFITSFIGKLPGAAPTSAGPLGGLGACVPSTGGNPAECAWADNDTFGLVASPTLDAQALASEMRQIRPQVELRAPAQ